MPARTNFFVAADSRVRWLRIVLLGATLLGMLSCVPLWLTAHEYPGVPLITSWPVLPAVLGPLFLCLILFSLLVAAIFFRPAIIFFLVAIFYLYGCDQNRGQPWMYLYWVMLLLNLLPERTALAACRAGLSLVYLWAGVQKLNAAFFHTVPAWFVQPATGWGLPDAVISALRASVWLAPFFEIFIGVGVWFPKTRWSAIWLAAVLHTAALVFLGPFGHNFNLVVWPWNIAMVALLVVLFGAKEYAVLAETLRDLRRSLFGAIVIALFGLLPVLSFSGGWDSYFSFALYSANLSRADLYVSQKFRDHLPARLQTYVHPVENFDPAWQLPFVFEHSRWAAAELGVPPMPEPRGYVVMFRRLAAYDPDENDCRMVVETRGGKILLYRAGEAGPTVLK